MSPQIEPRTGRIHDASTELGRLAEVFVTFQGEGPHVGKRQIFVRLAGCDVGCRFCDTPDALRGGKQFEVRPRSDAAVEVHDNPVNANDVARIVHSIAAEHAPIHAVSITGGEPLEQPAFLRSLLPAIAPLRVLLETAGIHRDALASVLDHVAIVSMDIKLPSVARIPPRFEEHRKFLALALDRDRGAADRETYVKVIVSPALVRDEFVTAAALVAEFDPALPFIIQPETDRRRQPTLDYSTLSQLAAVANAQGLSDVRVIPQVHKFLLIP